MTGGSAGAAPVAGRRPRGPLPRRSRKRWAVAAGVAFCWLAFFVMTDSVITATAVEIALGVCGILAVAGLRALGVTADHPWLRRMAERPWRDGQDVFQLALRHLPDVFVVTPSGSVLAPDLVELRMNPDDLDSLSERMELGLVAACATEAYEDQAAARGARFPGNFRTEVRVVADSAVPAGRYRLRQGVPVSTGAPASVGMYAVPPFALGPTNPAARNSYPGSYPGFLGHDGNTRVNDEPGQAEPNPAAYTAGVATVQVDSPIGPTTVREPERPLVPALQLVTGDSTIQTRMPGARAGRGAVELALPDVPTVSREHARFNYSEGRWWIANLGRNGLTLNGVPVAGEQPLSDGDSIRWGMRPDALLSRVQIR